MTDTYSRYQRLWTSGLWKSRFLERWRARPATVSTEAAKPQVAAPSYMRPLWCVDKPSVGQLRGRSAVVQFAGWIAVQPKDSITSMQFRDENLRRMFHILTAPRPDVETSFLNGIKAIGFSGEVAYDALRQDHFSIEFTSSSEVHEIVLPVPTEDGAPIQRSRQERIAEILRCPKCANESLAIEGGTITCRGCDARYSSGPPYDLLPDEFRREHGIVGGADVSANGYDGPALNLINKHQGGLVLDCGSGQRTSTLANVVAFDVQAYPCVDVLGVGERLPFKDASFDGVLSIAVLEHVQDPFRCAREISRVLKPGGTLYSQVPLLAPVHAFPDHFYNMTQRGLTHLFEDTMRVDKVDVLNFGQPIFTLTWFLNKYLEGLPPETARSFLKMRVEDLIRDPKTQLAEPHVYELSGWAQRTLACVNYLVATKK